MTRFDIAREEFLARGFEAGQLERRGVEMLATSEDQGLWLMELPPADEARFREMVGGWLDELAAMSAEQRDRICDAEEARRSRTAERN